MPEPDCRESQEGSLLNELRYALTQQAKEQCANNPGCEKRSVELELDDGHFILKVSDKPVAWLRYFSRDKWGVSMYDSDTGKYVEKPLDEPLTFAKALTLVNMLYGTERERLYYTEATGAEQLEKSTKSFTETDS